MLGRLPRQWLLQPSEAPAPDGAVLVNDQNRWALYAHRDLVWRTATGSHGTVALCGVATDAQSPTASMADIAARLSSVDQDHFERALQDVVGCYVVFAWSQGGCRILTDPAATLGVYYDPRGDRVVSTPCLLGDYPRDPRTQDWFGAQPQNNWVPSPHTIFEGMLVLPANHVLEAGTWNARRFWPIVVETSANADVADRIGADLRTTMDAVVRDGRTLHMSLTGGYDSRSNLAASRAVLDQIRFFTLKSNGVSNADLALAQRLVSVAGVELRVIDCPQPTPSQLDAYDQQCGFQAFGARREIVAGCKRVADGPAIHIHGGLGVLLKNFYGARVGSRSRPVCIEELLTDFGRPPKLVVEGVREWLDSVKAYPPQLQRTLMYLEQRAPRWMGPADLASTLYYDPFCPFCSRRIAIAAAFAPDELLESGRLHKAVIARLWPELLEVPFTKGRSPLRRAIPRGLKERLRPLKKFLDLSYKVQ